MQTIAKTTDIFIDQGCTFRHTFKEEDVTGHDFYASIRKHQEATEIISPSIIDIDDVLAEFTIYLSNTETLAMKPMTYIYTVIKRNTLSGEVSLVASGNAIVSPGTTIQEGTLL